MEITGTLKVKGTTKQVSEKFSKRDLVITVEDGKYPQHVSLELSQERTELLNTFNVGDTIKVQFNIRGREWNSPSGETKYFNTLDVWSCKLVSVTANPVNDDSPKRLSDDDLGF